MDIPRRSQSLEFYDYSSNREGSPHYSDSGEDQLDLPNSRKFYQSSRSHKSRLHRNINSSGNSATNNLEANLQPELSFESLDDRDSGHTKNTCVWHALRKLREKGIQAQSIFSSSQIQEREVLLAPASFGLLPLGQSDGSPAIRNHQSSNHSNEDYKLEC